MKIVSFGVSKMSQYHINKPKDMSDQLFLV